MSFPLATNLCHLRTSFIISRFLFEFISSKTRRRAKSGGRARACLAKIQQNSGKICEFFDKNSKISAIFNENFEIRERCKGVHCVDLGESFPTHIYLQILASIQPRTSPFKFAHSPRTDPPGLDNGGQARQASGQPPRHQRDRLGTWM